MPLLSYLLYSILGCQTPEDFTRAYQMETLADGIGGPKSMAQPGDFIIENGHLRFAITGNRPSMGPHTAGGSLVDADIQRNNSRYANGFGNDQLAEIFTTVNINVAQINHEDGEVIILNDGSNGEPARVCAAGTAYSFISLFQAIWGVNTWLTPDKYISYSIRTDYILAKDDPVITMQSYVLIGENDGCAADVSEARNMVSMSEYLNPETKLMDVAFDKGYIAGDFYLQGGSLNVFTPSIGFDEEGLVTDLHNQQINMFNEPLFADFLAGVGDRVSYGIMNPKARILVPLFTSSQTVAVGGGLIPSEEEETSITRFPDGTILQYTRWIAVGTGDVGSVVEAFLKKKQMEDPSFETGKISGRVLEEDTGISITDAFVFAYKVLPDGNSEDAPWLQWTTDVGDDPQQDGSFQGTLPVGEWDLQVHKEGRPTGEKIRINLGTDGFTDLVLLSPRPGSVQYTIVDEQNRQLPSKISFFTADDRNIRNTILGDSFIGGNPAAVAFVPYGEGSIVLPPGEYYAIATRGVEYELGVSDTFTVKDNSVTEIDLQVIRSVDTTGWISGDFHVHSFPSHDSGVSAHLRVTTMACEGVEYFTTTDHDFISDFRPALEDMQLEFWLNTAPGLEVTTLEVGHYLGFPLQGNSIADAGGAIDWTGMYPQEIIDELRTLKDPDQSIEPIVFVGHPRDGILGYFDQYGLDPYEDDSDLTFNENILSAPILAAMTVTIDNSDILRPENFSTDFDAIEVLGGKRFDTIRTPLHSEIEAYKADLEAAGTDPEAILAANRKHAYPINTRTMEEQEALISAAAAYNGGASIEEVFRFDSSFRGHVDDWFSLLNLGYRSTALGNSDTHGTLGTESGCPRNYVFVGEDEPVQIDDETVAQAIRNGHVIASYGPFVELYANEDTNNIVGTTVSPLDDGSVSLHIKIQAPLWIKVGRVEIYENGTLIHEIQVEDTGETTKYDNTTDPLIINPNKDSWYVVIVTGPEGADLSPLFTPVERPVLPLQELVTAGLRDSSSVPLILLDFLTAYPPIPRSYPIMPMALTNPIWVDFDQDGEFTPPGLPDWLLNPNP